MKLFIVATPLFDAAMAVQAYRLCDRSGESVLDNKTGHSRMAGALQSPGLDLVEKLGTEALTGGLPLFVEINQLQLMTGMPIGRRIAPQELVCVLPGGLANDDTLLQKCKELKEAGYTLALDDFPLSGIQSPFFQYMDYLVLNCQNPRFPGVYKAVRNQLQHIRLVLTHIPNMNVFNNLAITRGALFGGDFYNQPITAGISKISPVKVNALQLMNQVNQEDFDLSSIARIVERDPALSISLLRFINSEAVGLKNKVGSIQSAVAILGQQEVRHWATVAIQVSLAEDRPGEITKLSLTRAKFAENLAGSFELGVFQPSLFMAGLFSLLDVILQRPMPEAMSEVAVDDKVRKALVDRSGPLYPVIELIYAYERADWDECSRLMILNNVDVDSVNKAYVDAITWYNQLLKSISE